MIEKSFKSKFFLKFTAGIIGGIAIVIAVLYLILPRPDISRYAEVVASFIMADDVLTSTFIIAGAIEVIFITLVIVLISVFASHKIAGPIYRLEKAIDGLSNADLGQTVRFRGYDQLHNVAPIFNNMLHGFRERLDIISRAHEDLEKARKGLDNTPESVERLKEKIDILEKEIKRFTL
ncbi:MAG: methyl-accepting chemotaxis protein [Nitrospirae bacterium]|nr:methyl-accepting chemotaxis protein [Nitrospirota bacterium]